MTRLRAMRNLMDFVWHVRVSNCIAILGNFDENNLRVNRIDSIQIQYLDRQFFKISYTFA